MKRSWVPHGRSHIDLWSVEWVVSFCPLRIGICESRDLWPALLRIFGALVIGDRPSAIINHGDDDPVTVARQRPWLAKIDIHMKGDVCFLAVPIMFLPRLRPRLLAPGLFLLFRARAQQLDPWTASCPSRALEAILVEGVGALDGGSGGGKAKKTRIFDAVSFAVHRSGESAPCGVTAAAGGAPSASSDVAIETLEEMGLCNCDEGGDLDKYQFEAFLTGFFAKILEEGTCGPTTGNIDAEEIEPEDDEEDPFLSDVGLEGWCDMGPDRRVVHEDSDRLVRLPNSDRLPCRFYTREGLRVDSLTTLATLAKRAMARANTCVGDGASSQGTCSSSDTEKTAPTVLHLYAVPAGRMFYFAQSYVGEKFVIDHMAAEEMGGAGDSEGHIVAEVISVKPRVFELHNFFTLQEAANIIDKAEKETSETYGLHRSTTGSINGTVFG